MHLEYRVRIVWIIMMTMLVTIYKILNSLLARNNEMLTYKLNKHVYLKQCIYNILFIFHLHQSSDIQYHSRVYLDKRQV